VVVLGRPTPALAEDNELRARSVPLLKPERLRSVGKQAVRVPLEAASDQRLAPADVTVVAGSAHVARASDGSVVLAARVW
jgi:hypothetical protein